MNPLDQSHFSSPTAAGDVSSADLVAGNGESEATQFASPARLGMLTSVMRRHLDRLCRQAHEQALELLADDGEMLRSSKAVRLAVYRSLRTLKACEAQLRAEFVTRVAAHIAAMPTAKPDAGRKPRALRMMCEEDLEQELLCATFVAQVDAIARPALVVLARALGPGDETRIDRVASVIGPRPVLDAYLQTVSAVSLEAEVRVVLLRALHAQMLGGLPETYRECVQMLGAQDAEFALSVSRGDKSLPAQSDAPSNASLSPAALAEEAQHGKLSASLARSDLLAAALQLLAGKAQARRSAAQPHWTREQLVRALILLQAAQKNTRGDEQDAPAPLAALVEAALRSANALRGQDRVLSETDLAVADLVETLFELLVADADFPPQLVPDLFKLRIPFLRLTLDDRQLLLRRDSAARQLLEALVRGALEFGPGTPRGVRMLACCRTAIADVLVHYGDSPAVFVEILEVLQRNHERVRSLELLRDIDADDSAENRERLQLAWQTVAEHIGRELAHGELPPLVHELLRRPWAQYMVLVALRHGADAVEFRNAAAVATSLRLAFGNWATLPSCRPARAQQAMHQLASTAIDLRNGLELVGYSAQQMMDVWRSLTRLIVDATEAEIGDPAFVIVGGGHDIDTAPRAFAAVPYEVTAADSRDRASRSTAADEAADYETGVDARRIEDTARPSPGSHLPIPDAPPPPQPDNTPLEVGQLVDLHTPDQPATRLKLCWRGVSSGWHVFVNQAGVKALELPASRVASMLANGTLVRCTGDATAERTLVSLFDRLASAKRLQEGEHG